MVFLLDGVGGVVGVSLFFVIVSILSLTSHRIQLEISTFRN